MQKWVMRQAIRRPCKSVGCGAIGGRRKKVPVSVKKSEVFPMPSPGILLEMTDHVALHQLVVCLEIGKARTVIGC